MLASFRQWHASRFGLIKRFRKGEDGATAVEFALVALPFFGMLFAIMELAIFFLASRFLEDGLFSASRKILTQRLDPATICTTFRTEVNNAISGFLAPSRLTLQITPLTSFSSTGTVLDLGAGGCTFGATGQTMLVQATYDYPFKGFRFVAGAASLGTGITLSAATAFRVE
jgi:Flp pilus assembly protein TadG